MDIDRNNTYVQSISRWYSGNGRNERLSYIKYIINEAFKLCDNFIDIIYLHNNDKTENVKNIIHMNNLLKRTNDGLNNLMITYVDDQLTSSEIKTIQDNINNYCENKINKCITDNA